MGKFTHFEVPLASLSDGHYEQDFHLDTQFFKNMENPDVIDSDVNVHLDLIKKNGMYDCTFICKGLIHIPCDRCLDPLDHEVDTTYHITVRYGETYSDDSDDVLVIPESDPFLNVAYLLYDTVLLTIPMRHVHPMGKCNRAMASVLSKHSGHGGEEEVEEALDEVDSEAMSDE